MPRTRNSAHYHRDWETENESATLTYSDVTRILLQEIRDELKKLNRTFDCHRFQRIPDTLNRIDRRLSLSRKLTKGRPK